MDSIRCEFISKLKDMPEAYSKIAIESFDGILRSYNFTAKCTDLTTEVCFLLPEIDLYVDCHLVEGQSKEGLHNRRLALNAMSTYIKKPLKAITALDIRSFLYAYKAQRKIKDNTLESYRSYLSAFFNWCVAENLLDKNPMANVKPIKYEKPRRKALTQLELEKLRKGCKSIRDVCIVEMLYSTGCRVSELANLKLEDIDFNDNSAIVHGKEKKVRQVFLNAKATVALKDYLATRNDTCPYVFVKTRKVQGECEKISTRSIQYSITDISKRAGFEKPISPHILRHTTATVSLNNGMPLSSIQTLLGHSSPATTLIYTDIDLTKVHNEHIRCVI